MMNMSDLLFREPGIHQSPDGRCYFVQREMRARLASMRIYPSAEIVGCVDLADAVRTADAPGVRSADDIAVFFYG